MSDLFFSFFLLQIEALGVHTSTRRSHNAVTFSHTAICQTRWKVDRVESYILRNPTGNSGSTTPWQRVMKCIPQSWLLLTCMTSLSRGWFSLQTRCAMKRSRNLCMGRVQLIIPSWLLIRSWLSRGKCKCECK